MDDITDHKRIENNLQMSEAKFSAAFRACPDLMSITRLSDGVILDVNEGYTRLLGYTRAESIGKKTTNISIWADIADRAKFITTLKKFGEIKDFETTLRRKDGTLVAVIDSAKTFDLQGEECVLSVVHDNSQRKQAEKERLLNLKFMENMDKVNRAMQGTTDLEQMMGDVLDVVLAIFDCDRAWLVYPSNPGTTSYTVPMERTKPEYPGAFIQGAELPIDPDSARLFQLAKKTSEPLVIDANSKPPLPALVMKRFQVKSQMVINIYPKIGKSYMFGLHQCSYPRVWTAEEKRLFRDISRRLSDSLTSLLVYRDLQKRESEYRRLVETANEGIWVIDKDRKTTFVNQRLLDMFGYTEKEMLRMKVDDLVIPEELVIHKIEMQKRTKGNTGSYERRFICKNGKVIWVHLSGTPIYDNKKQFIGSFGMLTDITDKKIAEIEVARNSRALRMVSDINQALIRITDENILLNDACRIAVEVGGYRMAWIGYTESDKQKTVRPIVSFGVGTKYLDNANITWANNDRGRGPTGLAIRTGKIQMSGDILNDPKMTPWSKAAVTWGFKSSIALPLIDKGASFGVLNIYASETNAFSKEEIKILQELSSDLAFGIITQRGRIEQKLMTEKIKKNETALVEAQRIGRFGNWDWDIKTDKINWSEEYYRIFGFDPKKSPPGYEEHLKIYTPESIARLDAAVKKNMKTGESYMIDLEIATPNAPCRWITARSETVYDDKGKIIGLRGTAQDITERKLTEEKLIATVAEREKALRESQKLALVVENTFESVALIDLGKSNLLLYVNKAWEAMFGLKKEQIVNKHSATILDAVKRDKDTETRFWNCIKNGTMFSDQIEWPKKSGELFWADVNVIPIQDEKGNIYMWADIIRDITEEKNIDLMKTEFVSLASHQLRTPLTGSKWFLELLMRNPQNLTDQQLELLRGVISSTERTITLVDDLLNVTRLDTGKNFNLILKKVDVIPLIGLARIEKQHLADSKKVSILLDKKLPNSLMINIDKDKVTQVFENLLDNAVKYSLPNTKVVIGIKINTDHVTFCVKDQGIGIPFKNQHRIFNRFFRADNVSRIDNTGTGLGLYIAKGIVECHQGKIWFESEEGKGSTFYFSLPISANKSSV